MTEKMDYSQTGALWPGESLDSPRGTCSCVFMEEVTVQASSVPKERQRWEKYRLRGDRNKGDVPGGYLLETSSLGNYLDRGTVMSWLMSVQMEWFISHKCVVDQKHATLFPIILWCNTIYK